MNMYHEKVSYQLIKYHSQIQFILLNFYPLRHMVLKEFI